MSSYIDDFTKQFNDIKQSEFYPLFNEYKERALGALNAWKFVNYKGMPWFDNETEKDFSKIENSEVFLTPIVYNLIRKDIVIFGDFKKAEHLAILHKDSFLDCVQEYIDFQGSILDEFYNEMSLTVSKYLREKAITLDFAKNEDCKYLDNILSYEQLRLSDLLFFGHVTNIQLLISSRLIVYKKYEMLDKVYANIYKAKPLLSVISYAPNLILSYLYNDDYLLNKILACSEEKGEILFKKESLNEIHFKKVFLSSLLILDTFKKMVFIEDEEDSDYIKTNILKDFNILPQFKNKKKISQDIVGDCSWSYLGFNFLLNEVAEIILLGFIDDSIRLNKVPYGAYYENLLLLRENLLNNVFEILDDKNIGFKNDNQILLFSKIFEAKLIGEVSIVSSVKATKLRMPYKSARVNARRSKKSSEVNVFYLMRENDETKDKPLIIGNESLDIIFNKLKDLALAEHFDANKFFGVANKLAIDNHISVMISSEGIQKTIEFLKQNDFPMEFMKELQELHYLDSVSPVSVSKKKTHKL